MKVVRMNDISILNYLLNGQKNLVIDSVHSPFSNIVDKIMGKYDDYFIINFRNLKSNKIVLSHENLVSFEILFAKIYEYTKQYKYNTVILANIDVLLVYLPENTIYAIMKYIDKYAMHSRVIVSFDVNSKDVFFRKMFPVIFDNIIEYKSPVEIVIHRHSNIDLSGRTIYVSIDKNIDIHKHIVYENGKLYYYNVRVEINDKLSEKALYETIFSLLPLSDAKRFFRLWAKKYIDNFTYILNDNLEKLVSEVLDATMSIGGGSLKIVSFSDDKIIIEGKDLFPKKLDNWKGHIHYLYVYTMEEILKKVTHKNWIGEEVSCQNSGDDKCLFVFEIKESDSDTNSLDINKS